MKFIRKDNVSPKSKRRKGVTYFTVMKPRKRGFLSRLFKRK